MIERLQRALEHLDELSPEAQNDLAELIEEQTEQAIAVEMPEPSPQQTPSSLPQRIRTALAAIGSSRDLLDDDEFAALDRIRHESVPTPPIDLEGL